MNKAKQILQDNARLLKRKAAKKRAEAEELERQAASCEAEAAKIK